MRANFTEIVMAVNAELGWSVVANQSISAVNIIHIGINMTASSVSTA